MNSDTVQSLVRNVVQVVAGYFVAKGMIDNDTAEAIISGVVSVAVAAWGVWHQLQHRKEKNETANTQPASGS